MKCSECGAVGPVVYWRPIAHRVLVCGACRDAHVRSELVAYRNEQVGKWFTWTRWDGPNEHVRVVEWSGAWVKVEGEDGKTHRVRWHNIAPR